MAGAPSVSAYATWTTGWWSRPLIVVPGPLRFADGLRRDHYLDGPNDVD
jgi:hypothetical protein